MILVALMMLAASGQSVEPVRYGKPLYQSIVGEPTGRNGYEEFVEAASLYTKSDFEFLRQEMPAEGAKDWLDRRRAVAAKCVKAFDLIHQGTEKDSWFPKREPDVSMEFGELDKLRTLAKVMCYWASVNCADGRPDAAANTLADGLKMAAYVSESSESLHYDVGNAMTFVFLSEFDRDRKLFTPEGLNSIEKSLSYAISRRCLTSVMLFENDMVFRSLTPIVEEPGPFYEKVGLRSSDDSRLDAWLARPVAERKPIAAQFLETRTSKVSQQLATLAQPESAWSSSSSQKFESEVPGSGSAIGEVPDVRLESERLTVLRLAKWHCLVLRHFWQFGILPTNLESVGAPELVNDPQTNKSFRYQLTGKSYVLSAIGADGSTVDLVHHSRRNFDSRNLTNDPPPAADSSK